MKTKLLENAALMAAIMLGATVAQADVDKHIMVTPADLVWTDVGSLPRGAKAAVIEGPMSEAVAFTVRLKFPAGFEIPPHSHPSVERVTVLSGTFNIGMGDKLDRNHTSALGAGSVIIMPPGSRHYVWTAEETVVQLNGTGPWGITYVNPADDPRKQ
jgi:quercetin dioxygenase-like cupin family protein